MSADERARQALRLWRLDPNDRDAAFALACAWERAGLFGADPEPPAPAPRMIPRTANATETRWDHPAHRNKGATLHSYGTLVAVVAPSVLGVAYSPDAAYSRTSKKHVRQWADGLPLVEVTTEELAQLAAGLG